MPGSDPCQTLRELLDTMHILRAPGGCPWDAEQTPESLAPYILEEACETIEAIETGTVAMIVDELGDLLLQIVFQAEIFAERGQFDFADVATAINAKLLRRHPHVFDDPRADMNRDVLAAQWERIKNAEQGETVTVDHPLEPLPSHLPALQRAQKLLKRALRSGVSNRYQAPIAREDPLTEPELAQALLMLVQRAEASSLDAEQVLRRAVHKLHGESTRTPTNFRET